MPPAAPQPGAEKRKNPRYSVSIEVMMTIMIPELTFSPNQYRAATLDMSLGGCRLKTYQLTHRDYIALLKAIHYVRLKMHFAEDRIVDVRGSIVWLDYHNASTQWDKPHCLIGVAFNDTPDALRRELSIVASHMRSEPL